MNAAEVVRWGVDSAVKPQKGDIVVVPKGAWITGTHSSLPKNAKATRAVRVNWYDPYEGVVTWAGTGGYWHRTVEWYWPAEQVRASDESRSE